MSTFNTPSQKETPTATQTTANPDHDDHTSLFDSTAEAGKSITRELFFIQKWVLDGASAAVLHLTQSRYLQNYMTKRRRRLRQTDSDKKVESS